MRFAYIDSNGNEVPIPSVDALALRIELGAITSDTELYDAAADQWGPAHTHEIFHSLSRSAEEDEGFVAPPPPMAAPVPPPGPVETDDAPDAGDAALEADLDEPEAAEPEPEEPAAETEPTVDDLTLAEPTPSEGLGDVGELTLAEPQEAPAEDEGLSLAAEPLDEGSDFGGLDLAPATEGGMMAADDGAEGAADAPMSFDAAGADADEGAAMDFGAASADDTPDEPEAAAFDFGDMGGGLELEEEFEAPDAAGEPAMDFGAGTGLGEGDGGLGVADGGDFGGGLEQAMDFSSAGSDAGGPSLDLEQPMSEFSPEAPPAWMEGEGGDSGGDDIMDFSSISSEGEGEGPGTGSRTRTPKDRPSKPKFKKQRNLVGPIVGGVIIVALGLGGYTAWPIVSEMLTNDSPDVPVVVMPDIDAALLPEMRAVSDAAFADWFARQRGTVGPVTQAPPREWLAGIYLANASQFGETATFWEDVDRVLDAVDDIDLAAYHQSFETALGGSAVAAENRAIVAERADSGFVAASASREATFDLLTDLVSAATALHDFLLANEANIEHTPASATLSDPVLEASTTPEIREALETRIDAVTQAQRALDYLQFPDADELWAMMLRQIQENGIQ